MRRAEGRLFKIKRLSAFWLSGKLHGSEKNSSWDFLLEYS
jgi:hypothetical protein